MKEFEKYDKKYCNRETSHCCLNLDIYCEHCEELRKQGWRAALKWMLECDSGPETKELIEKELKSGDS